MKINSLFFKNKNFVKYYFIKFFLFNISSTTFPQKNLFSNKILKFLKN